MSLSARSLPATPACRAFIAFPNSDSHQARFGFHAPRSKIIISANLTLSASAVDFFAALFAALRSAGFATDLAA